jgi:hypothetical protein
VIEIVNRQTGELLDTDSVPGLAEVAALHDERIERLAEMLEDLLDGDSGTAGRSRGPIVWDSLTELERARTWQQLADWVGWLRGRYPLAHQLPLCWWRHPELVEELTALWLAWRDAYVEKGAPLSGGADWHGRWLPDFLRRIGAGGWNLACEGEHRPLVDSLYDGRQDDDPRVFTRLTQGRELTAGHVHLNRGDEEMQESVLEAKVASGAATRLGQLPDSPIAYGGRYWIPNGDKWIAVSSEQTVAFLADAERRLRLADEAVRTEQTS